MILFHCHFFLRCVIPIVKIEMSVVVSFSLNLFLSVNENMLHSVDRTEILSYFQRNRNFVKCGLGANIPKASFFSELVLIAVQLYSSNKSMYLFLFFDNLILQVR